MFVSEKNFNIRINFPLIYGLLGGNDIENSSIIRDALRNLVPIVQFKKREKHPWRDVTFSNVAGHELFLLSAPSYIFGRVLNARLNNSVI